MRTLNADDRPREKLTRHGTTALGDNELVAILIGHGRAGRDALAVANDLLAATDGLRGLSQARAEQLVLTTGVGTAQACRIIAALELGRRAVSRPACARPQFRSGADTGAYLLPLFGSYPVERFGLMLLDARYRLLGTRLLSVGSLTSVSAHPREVFREALLAGAAAVVAFHNHPSGDPAPSQDDVALTGRLVGAGRILGVPVLDSIVLGDNRFCSLRDMGLMT